MDVPAIKVWRMRVRVRLQTVFVRMGVPAAGWGLVRAMFVVVTFAIVTVAAFV